MGSDPATFAKVLEPGPFIEAGHEPPYTAYVTVRTCFSRIRSEMEQPPRELAAVPDRA